jgi:hypothetical protein
VLFNNNYGKRCTSCRSGDRGADAGFKLRRKVSSLGAGLSHVN